MCPLCPVTNARSMHTCRVSCFKDTCSTSGNESKRSTPTLTSPSGLAFVFPTAVFSGTSARWRQFAWPTKGRLSRWLGFRRCDCCCGHWCHLPLTQLTCSISVTVFIQATRSSPDKGSVTGTVSANMTDTCLLRCGLGASLGLCERSVETCPEITRPSECSSCLSFLSDLPSFKRRAAFRIR